MRVVQRPGRARTQKIKEGEGWHVTPCAAAAELVEGHEECRAIHVWCGRETTVVANLRCVGDCYIGTSQRQCVAVLYGCIIQGRLDFSPNVCIMFVDTQVIGKEPFVSAHPTIKALRTLAQCELEDGRLLSATALKTWIRKELGHTGDGTSVLLWIYTNLHACHTRLPHRKDTLKLWKLLFRKVAEAGVHASLFVYMKHKGQLALPEYWVSNHVKLRPTTNHIYGRYLLFILAVVPVTALAEIIRSYLTGPYKEEDGSWPPPSPTVSNVQED